MVLAARKGYFAGGGRGTEGSVEGGSAPWWMPHGCSARPHGVVPVVWRHRMFMGLLCYT